MYQHHNKIYLETRAKESTTKAPKFYFSAIVMILRNKLNLMLPEDYHSQAYQKLGEIV